MKKNIIVTTMVAAAAMATVSAFAADGNINFSGSVFADTCNITNASNGTLEVPMGKISSAKFTAKGDTAASTAFKLTLADCPVDLNSVSVKFDGATVAGDNSVLALTEGGATGLGIQLTDASQNVLPLNTNSTDYPLTLGAGDLNFVARYIATGSQVGIGPANSTASFSIIYN